MAVIVAVVVTVTVAIFLAIGLVVTILVTDHVTQRKTVVRRYEVNARKRRSPVVFKQIGRAVQTSCEGAASTLIAAPEPPNGVSIFIIPLCPARRKFAKLIATRTGVPGLGNQLRIRK